jgi:hypothetical protein
MEYSGLVESFLAKSSFSSKNDRFNLQNHHIFFLCLAKSDHFRLNRSLLRREVDLSLICRNSILAPCFAVQTLTAGDPRHHSDNTTESI